MEIEEGKVLDEQYKIINQVATGGMSVVYKAEDLINNRLVAIKFPLKKYEEKLSSQQRFKQAERIGYSLNHPNILKVYLPEHEKSRLYLVSEYVEGSTLAEVLYKERTLPLTTTVRIARQICSALSYIHQKNIIHRDLKPENIFLPYQEQAKLFDFGLAYSRQFNPSVWADAFSVVGTPSYIAPEQIQGAVTPQSDLYALGIILYRAVTGRLPFQGDNRKVIDAQLSLPPPKPREIDSSIDKKMEAVILKALEKDLRKRYQTAEEFNKNLERIIRIEEEISSKSFFPVLILGMIIILVLIAIIARIFLD